MSSESFIIKKMLWCFYRYNSINVFLNSITTRYLKTNVFYSPGGKGKCASGKSFCQMVYGSIFCQTPCCTALQ